MLFSGWAAIYDLAVKSPGVDRGDSVVDLVAAYLGVCPKLPIIVFSNHRLQPFIFFAILIAYKIAKRTRLRSVADLRNVWFVRDAPDETDNIPRNRPAKKPNRFYEFLSWVK